MVNYNFSSMSAIAVLAKAEILDEKIVPKLFVNDQHIDNHYEEMVKLFKMKYSYKSRSDPDRGTKKSAILGNMDWRLKINENDIWKSTIRDLWTGESKLVEWRFFPQMMGSVIPSHEYFDFDEKIDPKEVFIVKNFMIICMFGDNYKVSFLNLMSRKLFWVRETELENKIG